MNQREAITKFVEHLRLEKRRVPRTCAQAEANLLLVSEKVDLTEVTEYKDLVKAIVDISNERKGKFTNTWNQRTTSRLANYVKTFYRWALREKILTENPFPFHDFEKGRVPEQDYFHPELDKSKVDLLINWPNNTFRERMLLKVLMYSAIRRQELCDLTIDDIDFEGRFLHVRKGKGSKWRYVPIPLVIIPELKSYTDTVKAIGKCNYLFPREDFTTKMTGNGLGKWMSRLAQKTGIPVNCKKFRHSYAGYMIEKGVPPSQIAKILGHSKVSMTLDTYTHHKQETLRDAVDKVIGAA